MSRLRAWLASPAVGRFLRLALVLLAALFLYQTYLKAHRPQGIDLSSYLASAAALAHGENPYQTGHPFPYVYPLFLAQALVPLTWVPFDVAVAVWFTLGATSLFVVARVFVRLAAGGATAPWASPLMLLCLLFFLDPIQIDLLNGQVNPEVLLLSVLFLDHYLRGRNTAAGVLLGAAIAIKIVPAVLLLFLGLRRELRTGAIALGSAALLCLLPVVVAGPDVFGYYGEYAQGFLAGRAGGSPPPERIYFTPYGFVGHLLPALRASLVVKYGSVIAVLGSLAAWDLRRRARARAPLPFAAYLTLAPYLSPLSEPHHLLLAIPAAFLATSAVLAANHQRVLPAAATACFWVLLWLGRLDRTAPFYFLALTALLVALATADRRDAPAPATTPADDRGRSQTS